MKLRRLLALVLCLCMVLPLCSAAFATGGDPAGDPAAVEAQTENVENGIESGNAESGEAPADPAEGAEMPGEGENAENTENVGENAENAENAGENTQNTENAGNTGDAAGDTLGGNDGENAEDPETPEPPCTCPGTDEEKSSPDFVHAEGCPLYVEAEVDPVQALYEALMAAETYEAFMALLDGMSDDEIDAFFMALEPEQQTALQEKLMSLLPEPERPKTKSFTKAGPFKDPVTVQQAMRSKMKSFGGGMTVFGLGDVAEEDDGLHLSKNAVANADGSYTITLDAYTTGTVTSTTSTVPVDIVLVLDQSGSMAYDFNGDTTSTNSERRQYAMKQAVNNFINEVNGKYDASAADHRMAIVTYAGSASNLQGWTAVNAVGVTSLQGAINGLPNSPSGATNVGAGMNNAVTLMGSGYNYTGTNTTRQKVVVVFTDGVPTTSTAFSTSVANVALGHANTLKDAGVTVYTIGIFNDANPEQTYGNTGFDQNSNGTVGSHWAEFSWWSIGDVVNYDVPAGNRFLNYLSSNYGGVTNIGLTSYSESIFGIGYYGWEITANASRVDNRYYLTAGDHSTLNEIFTEISNNIETPTISLGSETVVKDIISPYFSVPANTQAINLYTADYNGTSFGERTAFTGGTVNIEGSTVSVTNFDFTANFVSETVKPNGGYGKKLIIEFTVAPKAGFLGGNGVETNGADSGVYVNGAAIELFDVPKVNVPIAPIAVTAEDKDVYLRGALTSGDLLAGATVTAMGSGNTEVPLVLGAENLGLSEDDKWKADYVQLSVLPIPDSLSSLVNDTTYTLNATLAPKDTTGSGSNGTPATASSATSDPAKIRVYKPVITVNDSTIYLGDTADYADNFNAETGIEWKHGDDVASGTMGGAPDLAITYTPAAGAFTADTDVSMGVKIGSNDVTVHTTFVNSDHQADTHQFTVFVKSCTLTIKKSGAGSMTKGMESFLFDVTGPNNLSLRVAVQGNGSVTIANLPVGDYTVTEVSGWSWRYVGDKSGTATLTADANGGNKTVTIANTVEETKWLSGDSFNNNVFAAPAQPSASPAMRVASAPTAPAQTEGIETIDLTPKPTTLPDGTVALTIMD